ncbi:hypothetical protein J437_LFUL014331 [Ladona fulva]|uniref:Uncharacterized protein n=1 Tax=Ladona fulva TaxID=123851 RepID=A0A8K0KGB2_LADFU|nr:hypothetical protein J437_LFUL014331 [Ladona fulva]
MVKCSYCKACGGRIKNNQKNISNGLIRTRTTVQKSELSTFKNVWAPGLVHANQGSLRERQTDRKIERRIDSLLRPRH